MVVGALAPNLIGKFLYVPLYIPTEMEYYARERRR
jgi:hypothetical protein